MNKQKPWYEDRNKLVELAEFMVEAEELTTAKELLDYFKNPSKYTKVWKLYEEEISGHIYTKPNTRPDKNTEKSSAIKSDDKSLPLAPLALLSIIPP